MTTATRLKVSGMASDLARTQHSDNSVSAGILSVKNPFTSFLNEPVVVIGFCDAVCPDASDRQDNARHSIHAALE